MIYFTPFIAVGAHNSTLLGVKFHPSETPLFSFIFNHVYGYYLSFRRAFVYPCYPYIFIFRPYIFGAEENVVTPFVEQAIRVSMATALARTCFSKTSKKSCATNATSLDVPGDGS